MKREIKFRGIYPHSGTWFYGCFVNVSPDTPRIVSEGFSTPIKIETLGQFTGLKDKNGTEIYEGDVIRYSQWSTKDGMSPMGLNGWHTGEVYYLNGKFVVKGNEAWDTLQYTNIEIIGNIHKN